MSDVPATRPYPADLRIASLLAIAAAFAVAAVIPYALALMPDIRAKIPISMPLLMLLQGLQGGVILGLLAFLGLRMGARTGLDAPWLRALVAKQALPPLAWKTSALAGGAVALVIVALLAVIDPMLPAPLSGAAIPPAPGAFDGFLASFYGAIGEEVLMRLFLMTLMLWIIARFRGPTLVAGHYWFAIVLSAVMFGAGHLPAASHIWPLTDLVVARVVIGNALAGIVFGWLYWKKGFESAMIAHFAADLVLHVVAPLALGTGA